MCDTSHLSSQTKSILDIFRLLVQGLYCVTITRDLIKEPIVMNCGMVSSMDTAHVLRASSSQLHALTILNFVLSSQVNMVMGVVDNSYPLKYLGNL